VTSVVAFDEVDSSVDSGVESLNQKLVVDHHFVAPFFDGLFEVSWHGFTGVDTGEDVSDESDLSQTKFFELFFVASDVSVGTVVQFGVERVDTGLTGGKALSELSNDLAVEMFDSHHERADLFVVASDSLVLESIEFSTVGLASFVEHVEGVCAVSTVEVVLENGDVVVVHFAKVFDPVTLWKHKFHFDLGSGFSELSDHFINTVVGFLFVFTTLWNKALWEFNENVSVVSTGAPSMVEMESVAVVVASGQHMEGMSAPVFV